MKDNKVVLLSLFFLAGQCCYAAEQNKSPIMDDVYTQAPTQDYLEFQLFDNLEDDDLSFFSLLEDSGDSDDESVLFEADANRDEFFSQDLDHELLNFDNDLLESLLNDYETEQNRLESNPRKKSRADKNVLDVNFHKGLIETVLTLKNMNIEVFNKLSAHRKIALLLQLTPTERAQLSQEDQEVLYQFEVNRTQQKEAEFQKFNTKYAHAIELFVNAGQIDRESFDRLKYSQKIQRLSYLRAEQLAMLSVQEQADLDNLKQQYARQVQAKRDHQHRFNNDLYAHAIEKVLEKTSMSIDAFNALSSHKKTTLLLKLTEQDRNELSVQEQEALAELQKKRKEELQLKKEYSEKRSADTSRKRSTETSRFNTKYAHAMQLIRDSSEIDRESFDKLENYQKIRKLLNLTPEQLATLSMQEQVDLEYLKERRSADIQAKRDYQYKFNNDFYTHAIDKVLKEKNISIDEFHALSAHKKSTLLLQLAEDDRNKLPQQEQEALNQLQEIRKKQLLLIRNRQLQLEREKFNKQHHHAIELIIDAGEIDRASFNALESDRKLELLFTLTSEQLEKLSIDERQNLENLQEKCALEKKGGKWSELKFNNELYARAIEKVLEHNNMSIEAFHELSGRRKTTLLLQLAGEDYSQLAQQEQEALDKLREDREDMNRLDNERHKKRTFEQKLNNEREQFNKQYLHAIELIIDAGKIDRAYFHALESDKKLELLLNLTPEQLEKLPIEERQNLQKLQRKRGLPKNLEKIKRPKFNDLYANAIEKVVEHNNMTIEDFNQLSAHKKTLLLLQLAEEDYSQLAEHEQESLHKLREDRQKFNRLSNERRSKRRLEQKLNNEREEFNKQYLHAIELIIDTGKIDRASFHALEYSQKLELLLNLTPEQLEKLPINERQNLQEKRVLQKKAEKIKRLKFNDLYPNAIERVLEQNNMSIETFNKLSREKKITLLLQLTEEDYSQLAQHEQEALHKLREDRKEINRLDAERKRKRELEQKLNNEREEFNKQYLHAIELIIDAGKIDRASFYALESDKKLELLLNLTPEELEKLPINERKNLQLQEKINGLRKRQKSN